MTQSTDISLEIRGEREEIAVIRLTRPAKRNALNDGLILALRDVMDNLPASVGAAVSRSRTARATRPGAMRDMRTFEPDGDVGKRARRSCWK